MYIHTDYTPDTLKALLNAFNLDDILLRNLISTGKHNNNNL